MAVIRVGVVGLGKIARDQHLPAIQSDPVFELAATVSPDDHGVTGITHHQTLSALLASGPEVDAIALCTPPQVRFDLAVAALERGLHVFLEKPPGATLTEVALLEQTAAENGATLFAGWHSRFAAGVAPAKAWLADKRIVRVAIVWREDVRVWHPGQAWIWEPGGLGVFDPGINALSIATEILPNAFFLSAATLWTPANRKAPIAAELSFRDTTGAPITMDLDWRQTGPQSWEIAIETNAGTLSLSKGGAVLTLPTGELYAEDREYSGLYARFAALIDGRVSEVDVRPLQLVADAYLRGRRQTVEAFED